MYHLLPMLRGHVRTRTVEHIDAETDLDGALAAVRAQPEVVIYRRSVMFDDGIGSGLALWKSVIVWLLGQRIAGGSLRVGSFRAHFMNLPAECNDALSQVVATFGTS